MIVSLNAIYGRDDVAPACSEDDAPVSTSKPALVSLTLDGKVCDHQVWAATVQADRIRNECAALRETQAERMAERDKLPEGRHRDHLTFVINNIAREIGNRDDEIEMLKDFIKAREAELSAIVCAEDAATLKAAE